MRRPALRFPHWNSARLGGWAGLGLLIITSWISPVGRSHQVEISGDVGGTLHIEPNDRPQRYRPHLLWFALTRRGGQTVPLAACDCQLAIYGRTYDPAQVPLSTVPLTALNAEQYQGIPAATVVFPTVGRYELVLVGKPRQPGDFQPFTLVFPVTVAR